MIGIHKMSEYNKEKLIEDLNLLTESKMKKKNILIECFNEIDIALKNGASLEDVLLAIKKRTGQTIHQRYAYLVLQKHREKQKKPVKNVVEEPLKAKVKEVAQEKIDATKEEVNKSALNDFVAMPISNLPEMIKPYATKEIDGIEYDVRQPNPPYDVFGSATDEFEFAGKMKEAGYEMKSEEYKKHFTVLMVKKKLRRKYYDANLNFKSVVIRYEKSSA